MIPQVYSTILFIMCICSNTIGRLEVTDLMTNVVYTKHGPIQGKIIKASGRRQCCGDVQVFLGIPYSTQPERFMPPRNPPKWEEVLIADIMKPVCPQFLPDLSDSKIPTERKKFIEKMIPFLKNESEDCLHLNIYMPRPVKGEKRLYPVITFIHGESFEWNSGNLYDGSVIAGFGHVIFVTINFRLGIYGFLKPDLSVKPSNYGLLDQIAALHWIRQSIDAFGGDPNRITVLGHGTGAISAHLLMLSPLANGLFHRVILMSGSALSSSALTSELLYMQVAHELNCPSDDMKTCLQKRTEADIKKAAKNVYTVPFKNTFTPVVDDIVVLGSPTDHMTTYKELFKGYDLLAGVTEVESFHMLEGDYWVYGMNTNEAKKILESYTKSRYERFPNNALIRTIDRYYGYLKSPTVINIRNAVLDALSDALVMAPLIQTMKYHSITERSNYFYVFGHHNFSDHLRIQKSVAGDELPYVLGVPLGGPSFHYDGLYNGMERCLSMDMMRYWTNFAKTGNPNGASLTHWPSYSTSNQAFILLDVKPGNGYECSKSSEIWYEYRKPYDKFWNVILPNATGNCSDYGQCFNIGTSIGLDSPDLNVEDMADNSKPTYNLPYDDKYLNFEHVKPTSTYKDEDITKLNGEKESSNGEVSISTTSIVLLLGCCILIVNLCIFIFIYRKRGNRGLDLIICNKRRNENEARQYTESCEEDCYTRHFQNEDSLPYGSKLLKDSNRAFLKPFEEDGYDAVKVASIKPEAISGKRMKRWPLSRQCSGSTITIDPHTKVKEWITQEIVHKCSPKFLRKDKKRKLNLDNTYIRVSDLQVKRQPNKDDNLKCKNKISVAVDATPAARTGSVLKQIPIELTKSLDEGRHSVGLGHMISSSSLSSIPRKPTLERSHALSSEECDDHSSSSKTNAMHKSSATIRLKTPAIIREQLNISHSHSRSDPSPMTSDDLKLDCNIYSYKQEPIYSQVNKKPKCLTSFSAQSSATNACSVESSSHYEDINVTSCDDLFVHIPASQQEALTNIKKRNFPKVLPDLPNDDVTFADNKKKSSKRLSLPSEIYPPISENLNCTKYYSKTLRKPPVPPPRLTSTLANQPITIDENDKELQFLDEDSTTMQKEGEFTSCKDEVPKLSKPEPKIIIKPHVFTRKLYQNSQIPRVVHPNHTGSSQIQPKEKKSVTTSTTGIPRLKHGNKPTFSPNP